MLLGLARSGALDPARGDVVLFANTTAEHPGTYDFAARVCDDVEAETGVACFWYEFCTVEEARRGGYARTGSYRLVDRRRAGAGDGGEPRGYRDDGFAFEEFLSWKLMLPNRQRRTCTTNLKVLPGVALLSEWLTSSPGPAHAGHHHDRRLVDVDEAWAQYRGKLTESEFRAMAAFCHNAEHCRRPQRWADYTTVPVGRDDGAPRRVADLWGRRGGQVAYVTLLGLRADEQLRIDKMLHKGLFAEGARGSSCRHSSQPAGEYAYAPMGDHGIDAADVAEFWEAQPHDLSVPREAGNCVFCFMKGASALRRLAAESNGSPGPAGIDWWAAMEGRYGRTTSDGERRFGFLDLAKPKYAEIAVAPPGSAPARRSGAAGPSRPCECTD